MSQTKYCYPGDGHDEETLLSEKDRFDNDYDLDGNGHLDQDEVRRQIYVSCKISTNVNGCCLLFFKSNEINFYLF